MSFLDAVEIHEHFGPFGSCAEVTPVADAIAATPAMPPELLATVWSQYVLQAKTPVRIGGLGQYLGSRPASAEYRKVDRAHFFLASRIPAPSARQQPRRAV